MGTGVAMNIICKTLSFKKFIKYQFLQNKRFICSARSFCEDVSRSGRVSDFYQGKSVLITGGTGFVGKVFIEKLLYSCRDIKKIYVLIRAKNNDIAEERLKELKEKLLFTRLKTERPEDLSKIVAIRGDIASASPNLAISKEDQQELVENVSVVFHSAATIRFNEPLEIAFNINYEGTKRMLELSKRMTQIEAFVHISTAYTNTDRYIIEEVVYPPPAKIDDVVKFINENEGDDKKTKEFLNGKPNTYTFTKSLVEDLVAKTHPVVPSAIVRPSMVKGSRYEPLKGWLDAWSIPTAILYSAGKGFNRVVIGHKNTIVDFIPVDYVVNMSIVAASKCNRKNKEVSVYNCCTSVCNPLTLQRSLQIFCAESRKNGFNDLPLPFAINTKTKWLISVLTFTLQTLPAQLADILLIFTGKKKKYVKINKKFVNLRDKSSYFTGGTWLIISQKAQELATSLSPEDRKEFPCDPSDIDWDEFMKTHFYGVKKYLVGDGVKNNKKS